MAAHRYWGFDGISTEDDTAGNIRLAEFEFRGEPEGENLISGGAQVDIYNGIVDASDGLDGDPDTDFVSNNNFLIQFGYDFGSAVEIQEFMFQASATLPETTPKTFIIYFSDDGVSWDQFGDQVDFGNWTAGQIRVIPPEEPRGKSILSIQHKLTESGISLLSVLHNVVPPSGKTTLNLIHKLPSVIRNGIAGVRLYHRIQSFGKSTVELLHNVVPLSGRSRLPVRHQLFQTGNTSLGLRHQPQAEQAGDRWQVNVYLNGADVTDQLNGVVRIEANAGAARLADFVLRPAPGAIDTQAFVKQSVEIHYLTYVGGALQTNHRRFTGIVDDATFDPVTRLINFACTDNLQGSLEALDFDVIDDVIGGGYSSIIFSETDDGWEYAQQRLQSQTFHYDKNVFGQPRKWSWMAKETHDAVIGAGAILDGTLSHTQSTSRNVINQVEIEFIYRYARQWQREMKAVWKYGRSFKDYLFLPSELPNREMFINSIDRNWWVKSVSFTKLPPSGSYETGAGETNWIINETLRDTLIFGAVATLAKRWIQDLEETYQITVKAPASIARFGVAKTSNRYAFQVRSDERFEDTQGTVPSGNVDGPLNSSSYQPPPVGSVQVNNDFYFDEDERDEFDAALVTAINIAKTQILASHHQNEVSVQTLLNPYIDIGQTIWIDTATISAKGTLGKLVETYDIDDGAAHSQVSINVFAPNVADQVDANIVTPDRADTAPLAASPEITLGTYLAEADGNTPPDPNWRGFLGNFAGVGVNSLLAFGEFRYPHEFRMETPPVEDELRLLKHAERDAEIVIAIPQEQLNITA